MRFVADSVVLQQTSAVLPYSGLPGGSLYCSRYVSNFFVDIAKAYMFMVRAEWERLIVKQAFARM
jgi:hypothetical protein